jgi:hypothetical protein
VWPYDLSTAAQRIPDEAAAQDIELLLGDERTALLMVGADSTAAKVVRDAPGRFRLLFDCPATPCAVYVKRAQ